MNIAICGDSWLTPDKRVPGAHFSEQLGDMHTVSNYARGGMSNIGICFQMQQALKTCPDLIIMNTTDFNRITLPIGMFDSNNVLMDIRYDDEMSATCDSALTGKRNAPIIDDVMLSIANDNDWTTLGKPKKYNLPDEVKTAMKHYISYLHNEQLKTITDSWAIHYWQLLAEHQNVKVVNFWDYMSILCANRGIAVHADEIHDDWIFHTTTDAQKELAKIILANITTEQQ